MEGKYATQIKWDDQNVHIMFVKNRLLFRHTRKVQELHTIIMRLKANHPTPFHHAHSHPTVMVSKSWFPVRVSKLFCLDLQVLVTYIHVYSLCLRLKN